ncbi:MAG: DUF1501 domain-containing protein [Pseudomonadota bacterium]
MSIDRSKRHDGKPLEQPEGDRFQRRRRAFFGQASCSAVGATTLFSNLFSLRSAGALAAANVPAAAPVPKGAPLPGNDYRALVCLLFAGGIDSFNVLTPRGSAEYAEYAEIRRDLALSQSNLLPIAPNAGDGREYGLHPALPEVQQLFERGDLAFLANVGTLLEPTVKADILAGSANLPLGLYSHNDQIMHWQTGLPDQRASIGWAGRAADLLRTSNANSTVSMNISLGGTNIFQAGNQVVPYAISSRGTGSIGITGYGGSSLLDQLRTSAIDGLYGAQYQNLFAETFAQKSRGAIDAHLLFSNAISSVPPLTTVFSDSSISRSFEMVARAIAARQALGARRQTFFIVSGGWDHHDRVLFNQAQMLPAVSRALGEFHAALTELNVLNDVVTFTASDFGRTLTSNGEGSDHAWGGNHMIMGGPVRGRQIYGSYPQLYANNPLDVGRGRLIPTTSCDEYFAELALWLGVAPSDLSTVLPNIDRFYSPGPSPPIGFLNSIQAPLFADGFEGV